MKLRVIGIFLLTVILTPLFFADAQEKAPDRILVVSSFHLSHVWTKNFCEELDKHFIDVSNAKVIDYLELNAVRNRQGNYKAKFEAYLPRIKNGEYSMIIGIIDDANKLIIDNYDQIPKNIPIILSAYRDMPANFKKTHPNITGFNGRYDLKQTLDLALSLYPETEEIAFACDNINSGRDLYEQAQGLLMSFKKCRFTVLYSEKYTTQQMLRYVGRMPKNSVVIFAPWRDFTKDNYASLEQIAEEMSNLAPHPFFILTNVLFGHGALGGYVTDGTLSGQATAELAQRIFNGKKVENIPFRAIPVHCMIDAELFDREKLDRSLLPPGTMMRNEKPSVFRAYPTASALVSAMLLLLMTALSVITVMYFSFRRKSHSQIHSLLLSHANFERLAEEQRITLASIDDALIATDSNGFVSIVNPVAEKFTGYNEKEMLGKPLNFVCRLISTLDNLEKTAYLDQVMTSGKSLRIEHNLLLAAKDGRKRPVAAAFFAIRNAAGAITGTVVILRDRTEEQKQRDAMSVAMHALENATELAHITCSQIVLTGASSNRIGNGHEKNWAFADGNPLSPMQWVHPDDLPDFERAWNELFHGRSNGFKLEYRSLHGGKQRFFVMMTRLLPESSLAKPLCSCVIQDITESGSTKKQLNDTNTMLNAIIDLMPSLLIIKDPQEHLKFVTANRKFAEMIGRPQSDIIGKTDYDLFDAELAKKYQDDDMKVAIAGGTSVFQETLPGPNGMNTIHTTKTVIVAPNGKKLVIGVASDITEITRSQDETLRFSELLRSLIDNAPVGLLLKDPDDNFRYLLWNAELGKNTNTPISDVEGKTDWEWNAYRDRAEYFRRQDEQVMRTNRPLVLEEELPISAGGSIIYRTAKIPITLSSGKRYLLGSFVNITDMRKLSVQLEKTVEAQKQLIETERIYSECLRIISLTENYADTIHACLAAIGKHCGADRCFIHCNRIDTTVPDKNYEYLAEGVQGLSESRSGFDMSDMPNLWNELNTKKVCLINDFQTRPELFHEFKTAMGCHFDLCSTILYSIFDDSGFYGVIGLESIHPGKTFSSVDEKILGSCAKLFLLHRERELRKKELDHAVMIREMIFANIDIPIMLFDKNGKLVNINEVGCRNMNVSQREALELPCNMLFCRFSNPPPECPVRKVLRTGERASFPLHCNRRDYHIDARPIFDEQGDLVYVLECAIDMTDFNASQQKLTAAMESAQAGDRAKTNFIATMNHELRTPLNAVIGFSELLESGGTDAGEQLEYVKGIKSSGKALLGMINDILDISKLDANRFELHLQKVDFKHLLDDLNALFSQIAKEKKITFKLILPAFLPEISIDAPRVRQIIVNLVGNALKFTRIGEVSLTVLFEPDDNDTGQLKLDVADTGIGISPVALPKIFQPFVQDEKVRSSRAYQGSGLGLAITRKLVDAMHGEISVTSVENIGSNFVVLLKEVPFDYSPEIQSAPETVGATDGKSLLIVDDLPMNLKILEALLSKMGRRCVSAESGQRALDLLKCNDIDMVLTDIWMPDMDGVALARNIRREDKGEQKTIFAITADSDWSERQHTGLFNGIFHKPIKLKDIQIMLQASAQKENLQ